MSDFIIANLWWLSMVSALVVFSVALAISDWIASR